MPTDESVLAICVNWNGGEILRQTVDSLLHSNYPGLEVLVVDNASTDDSLSLLPEAAGIVKLDTNLGYGGAINAVLRRYLRSDSPTYFLLLNNDVIVAEDTLSSLIEFARDKGSGVFGPRIVQFEDTSRLEAAWGKVSWSHVLARYEGKNASKTHGQWLQTRKVELLLGSALLVHRQILEDVGLFDEDFFMYHEEVDYLFRARRLGFPVYFCPFAEVIHRGAHSTRDQPLKKVFWIRRNAIYFLRKHHATVSQWVYFWTSLALSFLYNGLTLKWSRAATIWRAVREGLTHKC